MQTIAANDDVNFTTFKIRIYLLLVEFLSKRALLQTILNILYG